MRVFEKASLGSLDLKNRIIRSATFEGRADENGFPQADYVRLYRELAGNEIGALITGFVFVSREGKAMQAHQAGMDTSEKIAAYKPVTENVHASGGLIFLQIAHAGRQTRQQETGCTVWGPSNRKSRYFGSVPRPLSTKQAFAVIEQFVKSAEFAQQAGFDGVQIHAAHGYLIHQFLMKSVNHRCDLFRDGKHFLELILLGIQKRCGDRFPVLVKVSGSAGSGFTDLIRFLDSQPVAAIEISYGTMDAALNIMRGDVPDELVLKYNPVLKAKGRLDRWFKRTLLFPVLKSTLAPFTPAYNLIYAKIAKRHTTLPIICVGGIRKGSEMKTLVETEGIDFVGLCRPFICEPDFAVKLRRNENAVSRCVNCNGCTIMCDSGLPTRCYRQERTHDTGTKSNKLIC